MAEVIRQEPRNEAAWLLLADAVERKEHAIDCLERVLKFNPNSQVARKKLAILNEVGYSSTPKQGSPKEETAGINAPPITPSNEIARQTLDGLHPTSRKANLKFLIPAVIGILGFCILGGSGLFVFREYFLDNRTIALLSVTTPTPTATPTLADTATPTLTPTPIPTATPTLIPLSEIDLEPLLVQPGDLPVGYSASQVRGGMPDDFSTLPTAENVITQLFEKNGDIGVFGDIGGSVTVLLYESNTNIDLA